MYHQLPESFLDRKENKFLDQRFTGDVSSDEEAPERLQKIQEDLRNSTEQKYVEEEGE